MRAALIGVGVGPGDPELITLKAARAIERAQVISFIANEQGHSQAKHIAREVLQDRSPVAEIPVPMPMSDDRTGANQAYDRAASAITEAIAAGNNVVFLCEGDPLFFGSFAYLLERLKRTVRCEVVPGISSLHAASAALLRPLTLLQESFAVVSGRHSDAELVATLSSYDSVVIMKAGRSRQRILAALSASGRSHEANYVEYIGRDREYIETDISQLVDDRGPYFSLFVVTRAERAKGLR